MKLNTLKQLVKYYLLVRIITFCHSTLVLIYLDVSISAFVFLGLIGISNGFANVLGSSTWAEIYGVKYIGSIKALTTALMVFTAAFGKALFVLLIDKVFSIESGSIHQIESTKLI